MLRCFTLRSLTPEHGIIIRGRLKLQAALPDSISMPTTTALSGVGWTCLIQCLCVNSHVDILLDYKSSVPIATDPSSD